MSSPPQAELTELARRYEEGKRALSDGNYKKAIRMFDKALRSYNSDKDCQHDKAVLCCARSAANFFWKKHDEAITDAETAISISPTWSKGFFRKAEPLAELHRRNEAMENYRKAKSLESDPRSIEIIDLRLLRFEQEVEAEETGLYFRQLLPGVDICRGTYNPIRKIVYEFARGMQNIVYVIGDKNRQECMIVDACWDSDGILEIVQKDGMKVIGCIVTHNHFDHVGGKPPPPFASFGVTVQGLKNILEKFPTIPVYIHKDDADVLQNETGIFPDRIKTTFDGFEFNIGTIRMQTIHTPGHTPGSQCILINDRRLLTGDTLFANSCGRMDLPGGCPYAMYDSLKSRLAGLDQSLVVYPGHSYGNFFLTTIDREVRLGVLNPETLEEWLRKVGHSEQKHC